MKSSDSQLPTMPIKRKPVKKFDSFIRIFASIENKRYCPSPTATANPADFEGDIPNMNVGRAMTVIIVLHIVCVAGYFLREKIARTEAERAASRALSTADHSSNVTNPNITAVHDLYVVTREQANASLADLAIYLKISEQELRAMNHNVTIKEGAKLKIPRIASALMPKELAELKNGNNAPSQTTPGAVLARPNIDNAIPRAIEVIEEAPGSSREYKVRKGDTFSSIARKHSVKLSDLQAANKAINPDRLGIDQIIHIPIR